MIAVHPQYITDAAGNKVSVILPLNEFESLMEHLEDLDDIRLYDAAKSKSEESIDVEEAFKLIEAKRNS